MPNKLIVFLPAIFIIFISIFLVSKNMSPKNTPVITPIITPAISKTDDSTLYFYPDTLIAKRGQDNEASIQIETHGKLPTLLQLEMAYDPSVLTQVTLFPGDIFQQSDILLNENDESTGRISFAFALPPAISPQHTSGNAARIKFRVLKNTLQNETTIYFLPKTSILSNDTTIPLKIATGLKILINQQNQTASVSAAHRYTTPH